MKNVQENNLYKFIDIMEHIYLLTIEYLNYIINLISDNFFYIDKNEIFIITGFIIYFCINIP